MLTCGKRNEEVLANKNDDNEHSLQNVNTFEKENHDEKLFQIKNNSQREIQDIMSMVSNGFKGFNTGMLTRSKRNEKVPANINDNDQHSFQNVNNPEKKNHSKFFQIKENSEKDEQVSVSKKFKGLNTGMPTDVKRNEKISAIKNDNDKHLFQNVANSEKKKYEEELLQLRKISESKQSEEKFNDGCNNKNLKMHKFKADEREECSAALQKKDELPKHMSTHSIDSILACSYCSKVFKTISYLKRHMIRTHSAEKLFQIKKNSEDEKKTMVCKKFKGLNTDMPTDIKRNAKIPAIKKENDKHVFQNVDNSKKKYDAEMLQIGKIFESKQFEENFSYRSNDEQLETDKFAAGERDQCGAALQEKGELSEHMSTHTIDTRLACSYCSKDFKNISYLKRHMITHSEEKLFQIKKNSEDEKKPMVCKKFKGLNTDMPTDVKRNAKIPAIKKENDKHLFQNVDNSKKKYDGEILQIRKISESKQFEEKFSYESNDKYLETDKFTVDERDQYSAAIQKKDELYKCMSTHTIDTPIACSECSKVFKTVYYLKKHMITHSIERPFTCTYCNDTFKRKDNLARHIRSVHKLSVGRLHCNQCDEKFYYRNCLLKHLLVHSNKKLPNGVKRNENISAIEDENDKHLFQNIDNSEKKKHGKELSQIMKNFESKPFEGKKSYGSNDEHLEMDKFAADANGQYSTALQKEDELYSLSIHTIGTPLACSKCFKVFKTVRLLKQHMITHSTEKPFSCTYCNDSFKRKDHLDRHIRSIHNPTPKRFHCNQCNKQFYDKCSLKRHFLAHSDKKLFVCAICKKAFKFKCDLKKHTKVIHISDKKELQSIKQDHDLKIDSHIETTLESEKDYNKSPIPCNNYQGEYNIVEEWSKKCATYPTHYIRKTTPSNDHKPYACTKCHKILKTRTLYYYHLRKCHRLMVSKSNIPFKPAENQRKSVYSCQEPRLSDNIATKIGEKVIGEKVVCFVCDQIFRKQSDLLVHLENVHYGLGQFASSSQEKMKELKKKTCNQKQKTKLNDRKLLAETIQMLRKVKHGVRSLKRHRFRAQKFGTGRPQTDFVEEMQTEPIVLEEQLSKTTQVTSHGLESTFKKRRGDVSGRNQQIEKKLKNKFLIEKKRRRDEKICKLKNFKTEIQNSKAFHKCGYCFQEFDTIMLLASHIVTSHNRKLFFHSCKIYCSHKASCTTL